MKSNTKAKKLTLNLGSIRVLTQEDLSGVKGGFTYSLSLGERCQKSHDFTDGYTCKCDAAE